MSFSKKSCKIVFVFEVFLGKYKYQIHTKNMDVCVLDNECIDR